MFCPMAMRLFNSPRVERSGLFEAVNGSVLTYVL